MNYRHGFHAGSTADVFKHVALCLVLSCLARKDAPFLVLDTHAGAGLYDLESSQAQRSADAESGVLRLISSGPLPASFDSYLQGLKAANGGQDALRHYPGSPSLIRGMLRANDQLIAIENIPKKPPICANAWGMTAVCGYWSKTVMPPLPLACLRRNAEGW